MEKLRKVYKNWLIDKPFALQWGEWDEWHNEIKAKYPIRYFIQETLPDKASDFWNFFYRPVNRLYWAFLHRYHRDYIYHVIRPKTLKPGYHDASDQILHCNMDLLVHFYENGSEHTDWSWQEEHQHAYDEMTAIYNWWTNDYPRREEIDVNGNLLPKYPEKLEEWSWGAIFDERLKDDPNMIEYKKATDVFIKNDTEWYEKVDEMMMRLTKIRNYLWY